MSVDIRQGVDGSLEMVGDQDSTRNPTAGVGWLNASIIYNAPADSSFFVADRAYVVKGIRGVVDVAGSDGGAVTFQIRKVASGTALTSGTVLHSGTFNAKGTAATNQTLTLSTTASDLVIPAGTRLALDVTGTTTAATGCITVTLAPA